jgi:two-component system, NarL family, sensor histidine kinase UhpB
MTENYPSTSETAPKAPLRDTTILFIDDDPDVVWTTSRLLVEAGYLVVNGFTAAEALLLTQRYRPALVLLDVELPDGNGAEVARQIKLDPELAGVFVVLVSGVRVSPQEQAEGLRGGLADGYVVRPFSKVDFLARIEAFLRIRSAQEALRQSERQFRQMAESIGEVFWLASPATGGVLYVSPAYQRIWGRSCAELIENPRLWMDTVLAEDLPQVRRDFAEMAQGASLEMEYRIERPDGELRWISNRGYPLQDGSGNLTGIASDITARKLAEEESKEYARRLITLEEDLRKRISAELHDDIGQVLAALGLNLGTIGNNLPPEADGELRDRLVESQALTKEISRTVRHLMGELRPLLLDDFGLAEAIRLHADQYAKRTGIAVEVQVHPDFPRLGTKKEIALFRIVQEALNNICKHAGGTRVSVLLDNSGGSARLSISDDGTGFTHQPASLDTEPGWGLTIMRERAALVGGSFRVDTAPGAGTTITVELGGEL